MKRCPTCQRTYTDDSLSFCLQDGSLLVGVSGAPRDYDSDATLVNPPAPDSRSDMPTEVLNPQPAPTILSPQPAQYTTPQQPRVTTPGSHDAAAAPAFAPSSPPPASSNRMVTAGVITIAALLLALVGIGVALLVRNSPEGDRGTTTNIDNKNGAANVNVNVNVNSSVSNNANANASPAPTTTNSPPASNNARANSNGSQTPPAGSAEQVEAKILRDAPLTESDLAGLSTPVLRRLRNAVYARHGRTFNTPELQRYFDSRPWYRPRPDYSDQDLSPTDRANVRLIQSMEGGGQ